MDDNVTQGVSPETQTAGTQGGANDIVASVKAELEAQYRNEIASRDAKIEELNRVRGNLVNQVSNYKRMTEAGATQGSYTQPTHIQPAQDTTRDEMSERLQRTELQLQQSRFYDYAATSGYTDLRDPNLRPVLEAADNAVVEQMSRDGYNLQDPRTEQLYFKRILEVLDGNPLYTAYKKSGAKPAQETEPVRSGEVTASSTSGAAAEVGSGITQPPNEIAAKRLQDIRNAAYPQDGRRRTGRL